MNMRAWRRIKENETASLYNTIWWKACPNDKSRRLCSWIHLNPSFRPHGGSVLSFKSRRGRDLPWWVVAQEIFSWILKRDRITQAEIGKKQSISSLSPSCTEHGYVYKALLLTTRTFCVFSTSHVCHWTGQSYLWGFCWSTNSCMRRLRLLCFCQYPGRCKSCPRYLLTIIFFQSGAQIKSFD